MKKTIGEILKEHRINANISVKQISEQLISEGFKASEKTIYSWESNNSHPTPDALLAMCKAYGITDVLSAFGNIETGYDKPSKTEWELIRKYRLLDKHGIKTVNYVLNSEIERVEAFSELIAQTNRRIVELESRPVAIELYPPRNIQYLAEYFRSASAGGGIFILGNEATAKISVSEADWDERVDYVISVSGNSMEPDYCDGDKVMVSQRIEMQHGDVGIFVVDGKAYIKEYGQTELISRNTACPNIPISEYSNIVCMGKVIGKLTGEYEIIDD